MAGNERKQMSGEAGSGLVWHGLPEELARLIHPDVARAREARIKKRLNDETSNRVRRRRCAEIVAAYLLRITDDGTKAA